MGPRKLAQLEAIDRLREHRHTILLSTDIMRVAEKLCDRIGILYRRVTRVTDRSVLDHYT